MLPDGSGLIGKRRTRRRQIQPVRRRMEWFTGSNAADRRTTTNERARLWQQGGVSVIRSGAV